MRIIYKYPKVIVALSIVGSAVVTYYYSRTQLEQQNCSELKIQQGLLEIRSDLGLLNAQIMQNSIGEQQAEPNARPEGSRDPKLGTTLGDLFSPEELAELENRRGQMASEAGGYQIDRMSEAIDLARMRIELEKNCIGAYEYTGAMVFLQILFTALASLIAFLIGDLKGLSRQESPRQAGQRKDEG